jgi:hypothetical protein
MGSVDRKPILTISLTFTNHFGYAELNNAVYQAPDPGIAGGIGLRMPPGVCPPG